MRKISLIVLLWILSSCTQEAENITQEEINDSGFDTHTTSSYDPSSPDSQVDDTIDTPEERDTGEAKDTGHRAPEEGDTNSEDSTKTETDGDTGSHYTEDTGLSGQTDRDTGSNSQSGSSGTDTDSEEESDTSLDTATDTESETVCTCEGEEMFDPDCKRYCKEQLQPCYPEGDMFIPPECCNCVSDPPVYDEYCIPWCEEQEDTEDDVDTTPEGPEDECDELGKYYCDGKDIYACSFAVGRWGNEYNELRKITSCTGDGYICIELTDKERDVLCIREEPLTDGGPCFPSELNTYRCSSYSYLYKCEGTRWRLVGNCGYEGCEEIDIEKQRCVD